MSTNPSHILIARNSRGANTVNATETHAAASGVFRREGEQWLHDEEEDSELANASDDFYSDEGSSSTIDIEPTFTRHASYPGNVKIIVESTTFWAHKDILYFASPFFESALSGHWAETSTSSRGRPQSMSSVITISQPPTVPGEAADKTLPDPLPITFAPMSSDSDTDNDTDTSEILRDLHRIKSDGEDSTASSSTAPQSSESEGDSVNNRRAAKAKARNSSLAKLQGMPADANVDGAGHLTPKQEAKKREWAASEASSSNGLPRKFTPTHATVKKSKNGPDAVIVLKEERATIFHDFLKYVYPHLECTISWNNVEGLMNISHKLFVLSLQNECHHFLLTHAAGKPIKAMRIAELFGIEDLYRESSRFILDNPGGWTEDEMSTLSQQTLLKLEKRRNWFLERVLKLGLTSFAKDYQCCITCPDSANCARLLEEKWRQAYQAAFRFGAPQPSMVFRYLRLLEGVSPPLSLTHLSCQVSAKAFTATLFDRMFSLGVRGSGTDATPLSAQLSASTAGRSSGRHFLYCTLKPDPVKPKTKNDSSMGGRRSTATR